MNDETLLGGGSYTCDKCGSTHHGSTIHACNRSYEYIDNGTKALMNVLKKFEYMTATEYMTTYNVVNRERNRDEIQYRIITLEEELNKLSESNSEFNSLTFTLHESQIKKLNKWKEKIKRKHREYGLFKYSFTPTGIGDIIKVKSDLTGKSINLTEEDKW